jgi:hypothetical protein
MGNIILITRQFCYSYYPFIGIPLPKITDFAALLSWIPNNGLRGPWTLVFHEALTNLDRRGIRILQDARKRERQLKSWKSHRSIQELIASAQP